MTDSVPKTWRPSGTETDAQPSHAFSLHAAQIAVLVDDAPRGRREHAGNRVEQRRFARAVRAYERDDLALADGQAHIAQRLDVAAVYAEGFDLQHQAASAPR